MDTNIELPKQLLEIEADPRLKSVMDIPSTAWRIIEQFTITGQNCGILNVCLSSPRLDILIRQNSVIKTLHITGEKVFRVLLKRLYLNKNDVMNCTNTDSNDLERFAGSNWTYAPRDPKNDMVRSDIVGLNSSAEIANFVQTVNNRQGKWQFFAFKSLCFNPIPCESRKTREKFWNAVSSLLTMFGNFILQMMFNDAVGRDGVQSIYNGLLERLPRLELLEALDAFVYSDTPSESGAFSVRSDGYTLNLFGDSHGINALALLEKFPRFRTITIYGTHGPPPQVNDELLRSLRFPTVTMFVLTMHYNCSPLPLDRIPEFLPSLIRFKMECYIYQKADLISKLLQPALEKKDFQRQKRVIDIYQVYCEGRSLLESNIWNYMKNLSRINVVTVAEYRVRDNGTVMYSNPIGVTTETFSRPR